ncbi:LuxR family two component transcriptional regulator [Nocardia alba]|uniref:LuxR family two component transcriptional regulator n=2 Tax=Nocardia alba TaxID=225051 RepID=A0A4R1FHN6_9NOCA|nr:LuxR family two component transcriptional regulator [Nocardia alba]
MLGLEPDLEVVAHVGSGAELVAAWRRRAEDGEPAAVAVIDLQMPGIDGIDTAVELLRITPGAGTLIVTSHGRPGYLKRALAAGVRGFLPKTTSAATLAEVIRSVHNGGRYVDPELAAEAISAGDTVLTAREADVLEFAADGASVEDIAKRAHLSPGTTRNYLSSAMTKLGVSNRYEAALKAREKGWI